MCYIKRRGCLRKLPGRWSVYAMKNIVQATIKLDEQSCGLLLVLLFCEQNSPVAFAIV